MAESIGLADFLNRVKQELMQTGAAGAEGSDAVKLLMVEAVEVEIHVGVTREAKGGVNIHVVELGGGATREDTQVVRVRLQPLLSHEQRLAEMQRDPRWGDFVKASVEHTVKGLDPDTRRADAGRYA